MKIDVVGAHWGFDRHDVLHDISLSMRSGETVGLVGPNGSGKSSLLRLLAGLRAPRVGRVEHGGVDVQKISPRTRARTVAFVEQRMMLSSEMVVFDAVALGRLPHRRGVGALSPNDRDAVEQAIAAVGLTSMSRRRWDQLSGGEQQRVQLARAMAQQTAFVILDEPTNHLDIEHQLEILHLMKTGTATAIVALHDLVHAARFCDRIVVLDHGRIIADGPAAGVLDRQLIREVFRVDAHPARTASGDETLLFGRTDPGA